MLSDKKNSKKYSQLLNTPDISKTPEAIREIDIIRYQASKQLRRIEEGQAIAAIKLINHRYK